MAVSCENISCINGFGKGVGKQNILLGAFVNRYHDIYSQHCLSEIRDSNRCTMCQEIELSFSIQSDAPNSAKFRGGCRGPSKIRQRGGCNIFLLFTR